MIVRISGEDQFRLADDETAKLNDLDNAVVAAVERGDETAFADAFAVLLAYVREHGEPIGDDELTSSDLILPPADTSLAEAGAEFSGDGLIPD